MGNLNPATEIIQSLKPLQGFPWRDVFVSGSCVNEKQNRGTSAVSCAGESLGSMIAEFAPTPK